MFQLFRSHQQGACYTVQRKNNVYIFQDTVINIKCFQLQFTNILFIILTRGKLKMKTLYLGKYTHCSSAVPHNKHPDDGYGIAETCRCDKLIN
jgi:hypothetical protein